MSEADIIIGIYRGFQTSIGCGNARLSLEDGRWYLDWDSPRGRDGKKYAARYAFDAQQLAVDGLPHGFDPTSWGQMLSAEVRQQWGGNPGVPDRCAKPIVFDDGLETD